MMNELNYSSVRTSSQAREADGQRLESRKRNLLILVLHYLFSQGYKEAAQSLQKDTNIDLSKFDVCDNIDLETVLMEYESYYFVKFARYPKITKKGSTQQTPEKRVASSSARPPLLVKGNPRSTSTPSLPLPRIPSSSAVSPGINGHHQSQAQISRPQSDTLSAAEGHHRQNPSPKGGGNASNNSSSRSLASQSTQSDRDSVKKASRENSFVESKLNVGVQGLSVRVLKHNDTPVHAAHSQDKQDEKPRPGQIIDYRAMLNEATRMSAQETVTNEDRLLKPLGAYLGYNQEWRELAQVISRDIYSQNPNVRWDDIIGLDSAKRLVKEAVVYPIKYPQLFRGILSPWKGLLLYGPPGTGKTMLAKAVATETETTFFNISASTIVSKWRGDSEKLVRILFELARFHAPSTIFLDELDALMSERGSSGKGGSEHEGSRRLKTELLVQMDGLAKTDELVFLLAASNIPWELDHAMLRRLEKRILVDLPSFEARKRMFLHYLPPVVMPAEDGMELLSQLDYSALARKTDGYSGSDLRLVCKEAAMGSVRKVFHILETCQQQDDTLGRIRLDTIVTDDVLDVLKHTKPSANTLKPKYIEWQKDYESV